MGWVILSLLVIISLIVFRYLYKIFQRRQERENEDLFDEEDLESEVRSSSEPILIHPPGR